MKELPEEKRNIRSGSESTMFELFHDRKGNKKMRFRGRFAMELNTICRAIGTNFSRVFRHNTQKPQKSGELSLNTLLFAIICFLKTVFQLSTGFQKLKTGKICDYSNFIYNTSA
jgi:hypothetical protein